MNLIPQANSELVFCFPARCRDEMLRVVAALPEPDLAAHSFSVSTDGELVRIPYRVYHDVSLIDRTTLNTAQIEYLDCLLTRHYNGHVREESLRKILDKNHPWIPPFVVQLVGEYVIEILSAIRDGLKHIDQDLYRDFLFSNPQFLRLTKQRVISYRACYYSHLNGNDYVGFQIVDFFESLIASSR